MDPTSAFLTLARLRAALVALVAVFGASAIAGVRRGDPAVIEGRFVLAAIATGLLTFLVVDAARALLRFRGGSRRELVVSLVEGLAMGAWAFVAEPFASLDGWKAFALTGAIGVGTVVFAAIDARFRRVGHASVAAFLVASVLAHVRTTPAFYGAFHAAACLTALGCAARLGAFAFPLRSPSTSPSRDASIPSPALSRDASIRPGLGLATAAIALVTANLALSVPEARLRFWWSSPTATALARPLVELTDPDRDGGSSGFGAVDCAPFDPSRSPFAVDHPGDGIDQDCDGSDARVASPVARGSSGTVTRPDVLVLSIDALRADAAPHLDGIREVLGQPFEFALAVAPSVRTMNSFASMMRGRPLDGLPFERDSLRATLAHDRLPTLGGVLGEGGYRSVFVATHSYLAPRTGIVSGVEFLREDHMPYDDGGVTGLRGMLDGDDAIALLLEAARTTDAPLFAWTHLMETHEPYRASRERIFGTTRADYDRAVAIMDDRVARAIADFRALRERRARPVVVVVLGDHGEAFGEHGLVFHSSSVHAEQARVPFLLSVPGVPGRRIDAPVSTSAIAATLTELAGLPHEPSFHVPSLGACMASDAACPDAAVTELFTLARAGDIAMRATTTRDERVFVDRAHDVAEHYDRDRDPMEREPRVTSAIGGGGL